MSYLDNIENIDAVQSEHAPPNRAYGPSEIDLAAAEFIKSASEEAREAKLASQAAEPSKVEATQEQKDVPQEKEAEKAQVLEPKTEAKPEDPINRGLERLVEREVQIQAREKKMGDMERENLDLRRRLSEVEARTPSDLLSALRTSPTDTLKKLGLDPDDVIRLALAEKLGDKADPALRTRIEQAQTSRKIEALERQIAENERRNAAQAYYGQVAQGAQKYVQEEISKHPTLAIVAKTDPSRVHGEIMEEITRDAAQRAAQEPNGSPLPYQEAAERVEARFSAFRKWFTASEPNPVPNANTEPAKTVPTQGEARVNPPKSQSVQNKPLDRPLAPWLQHNNLEEEGIRAGVQEYRKLTQK